MNEPDVTKQNIKPEDTSAFRGRMWLAFAGLGFIYGAVAVFAVVCYRLLHWFPTPKDTYLTYFPELILSGIGVFSATLGVRLLRSVGVGSTQPSRVINEAEWSTICDQVKSGQEDPITQYIRLTSLTGFTGTFTKLGLTALPLATIGLTIFFSALTFLDPKFLDLAKLTLGAFIGSFVQKQITSSQSSSVKLPSGETFSVKPASP